MSIKATGREFLGTDPFGRLLIRLSLPVAAGMVINALYTKGDIADMRPEQKKRLAIAVEQIKEEHQK